jgi:paraquat-inducible protein B
MSRQANKTVIGAFVIGAVVLVVAGILIFGSGRLFSKGARFVMFFDGSVGGLTTGAPVVFRGVQVGRVTGIQMRFDAEKMNVKIPVIVEIESDRIDWVGAQPRMDTTAYIAEMVTRGMRARLQLQSVLTGMLMVELDLYEGKPARLSGTSLPYPEIPTIPAKWEELAQTLTQLPISELISKLTLSIEGIERTVNRPEVAESITNLNLALKEIRTLFQNIDRRTEPLAEGIGKTITSVDQLLNNTDRRIDRVSSGVEGTVTEMRDLLANVNRKIDLLSSDITQTAGVARNAMGRMDGTLASVQGVVTNHSQLPYELSQTLNELTAAARSIRTLADYLEQYPDALLRGKTNPGGTP